MADLRNPGAVQELAGGRLVTRLGRVVLASTELKSLVARFSSLGFVTTDPYVLDGSEAVDIKLEGTDLCLVSSDSPGFGDGVEPGADGRLLGWSWTCADVDRTRTAISMRCGKPIADGSQVLLPVDPSLSPAVATWLEAESERRSDAHPNGITAVDHVVLTCTDADSVCSVYESNFGLKGKRVSFRERRHAFLKVDDSMIEIVGPEPRGEAPASNHPWGLAFTSSDLDTTVGYLRSAGIDVPEPRSALQGGRITTPKTEPCGLAIAVLGN